MYVVNLKISNHEDAADLIKKYHTPLTTHFYNKEHFSSTEHLATPEEGREYLDLLLELAKTFPSNNLEFVRLNGACFLTVARLMAIAEIELSEHDKQHILDYTTVKYDSDYLNYACQIRDAYTMVRYISDFWDQVSMLESYYQEMSALLNQIGALPCFRLVKRLRLAHRCGWRQEWIREKSTLIEHDYVPRLCQGINSNYQTNLECAHPLIFYHRPNQIAGKLFSDQQTEDTVRTECESCDLYRQIGDENLARLLDLSPGFNMESFIFHPYTGEQIVGDERKQRALAIYPELTPYYDKFLLFDPSDNGDGYVSDSEIHRSIRGFAEIFDAEQYLPMANYSRRQKISSDHPESQMSAEELATANAILEFIESTK